MNLSLLYIKDLVWSSVLASTNLRKVNVTELFWIPCHPRFIVYCNCSVVLILPDNPAAYQCKRKESL